MSKLKCGNGLTTYMAIKNIDSNINILFPARPNLIYSYSFALTGLNDIIVNSSPLIATISLAKLYNLFCNFNQSEFEIF